MAGLSGLLVGLFLGEVALRFIILTDPSWDLPSAKTTTLCISVAIVSVVFTILGFRFQNQRLQDLETQ